MKKFKKDLSRFTDSHSLLTDIYNRLYWRNSGLVRKYEPKKKIKKRIDLKSNSLQDQLQHHIDLETDDDKLINFFIKGGKTDVIQIDSDTE